MRVFMKNIIFVCEGNMERSVVAEHLFISLLKENSVSDIEVSSRGTFGADGKKAPKFQNITHYPMEFNAAEPTLRELGLDLSEQVAKRIEQEDVEGADVVVAMTQDMLDVLQDRFPDTKEKMVVFSDEDVPDGYQQSEADYHKKLILQIKNTLDKEFQAGGSLFGLLGA